jgi:hypothetical protein
MRRFAIAALLTVLATSLGLAQQNAPWVEWSQKEAEKILNDSGWAQVQIETNTSEMTFSPTSGSGSNTTTNRTPIPSTTIRQEQAERNANRATEGAYNGPVSTSYEIRFLSAKPIREALANLIVAKQTDADRDKVKNEMQAFVDRNYGDFIVVTVSYEATDGRLSGKAFQDFNNAVIGTLKNHTYLERSDGKRVYLIDYRAPIDDGLGAKFVFSRTIDGKPFLTTTADEVRFYSEIGTSLKLNRRFKVGDMIYHGKLEY